MSVPDEITGNPVVHTDYRNEMANSEFRGDMSGPEFRTGMPNTDYRSSMQHNAQFRNNMPHPDMTNTNAGAMPMDNDTGPPNMRSEPMQSDMATEGPRSDLKTEGMQSEFGNDSNEVHSEFVHISQEHDSDLCNKLYKQWQDLQHCDITLAVRDGELRAHSCIVAAFSPKLKSVLENSTPRMSGVYIRLLFDVAVLRVLLNMMYTGVLSFNTSLLSPVLAAARWLQMEEVVRLCQDYREATGCQTEENELTDDQVIVEVGPQFSRNKKKKKKGGKKGNKAKKKKGAQDEPKPKPKKKKSKKKDDDPNHPAKKHDEMAFLLGKSDYIQCAKCMARFTKLDEFRYHVTNHPTFTCEICSMTYFRVSNLTRHKRQHHSSEHYLTCKKCDYSGKTETGLLAHYKEVHQVEKPFTCDKPGCTYSTWKMDFLHRHSEIHDPVKRYICDKCGQGFSQHAGLVSHHRTCYHLQQFLCDVCGQAFNHIQSMRAHRRAIHFGEKPYPCPYCNNRFSDQRNRRRHMLIHENAFPYQCEICKQKYRHSNSLKAHLKKHKDSDFQMHSMGTVNMSLPEDLEVKNQESGRSSVASDAPAPPPPSAPNPTHAPHLGLFAHLDTHHPASMFHDTFRAELDRGRERMESSGFTVPRSSAEDFYYSAASRASSDLDNMRAQDLTGAKKYSSAVEDHAMAGRALGFLSPFAMDTHLHTRINESVFPSSFMASSMTAERDRTAHLYSGASGSSGHSEKMSSHSVDERQSRKEGGGGGGHGSSNQSRNGLQTLADICFTSSL